jgi:hypothetical protein
MPTTWISNGSGNDSGNSGGSYAPNTQSVQWIHDHFAIDGDTIQVPNGTYTWTAAVTLTKAVSLQGQSRWSGGSGAPLTGGVIVGNNGTAPNLITITSSPNGHSTLSQLALRDLSTGTAQNQHVLAQDGGGSPQVVLIHDCYFETKGAQVFRSIDYQAQGGVIWNCNFWSQQNDNGSIRFKSFRGWSTPPTMGAPGDPNGTINVYVENCNFKDVFLQALDFDDGARVVVRYNTFLNSAVVSHGDDTSLIGGRHVELYNNTMTFTLGANGGNTVDGNGYPLNLNYWWYMRGGTGVVFNNALDNISSGWWGSKSTYSLTVQGIRRNAGPYACWNLGYPFPRQVGWGSDGSTVTNTITQSIEPLYVWANTGGSNANNPAVGDYNPDECGHGYTSSNYIQLNREYYVGSTKPGWSPYAYPHPLTVAGAGGGPGAGGGTPIYPPNIGINPPFLPIRFAAGPPTVLEWEDGPGVFLSPAGTPVIYNGQSQTSKINVRIPKPV